VQTFRPELTIGPLRAFIDEARDAIGDDALTAILAKYSLQQKDFLDATAWVSLEFVEALLQDILDATSDPDYFRRSTIRGMTPQYLGAIYPLIATFGNPAFTYRQLQNAGGRFNKTGIWSYENERPGFIRMIWSMPNGPRELKPFICWTRQVQLARVPLMFGQPAATVSHPECILRGDSACIYDVSWPEAQRRTPAYVGLVVGLLSGWALTHNFMPPGWLATTVAIALGIGGWALGRVFTLRRELSARLNDVAEHNDALHGMIKTNEQRYAELVDAKTAVEEKVEQRTHELRLTTQQLSETLTQVQELDRAKTAFFSNVSHDLRTPLTLILGPLGEMTQGREPPGGLTQAVDVMQRNGMRLLDLINQLLDLAKIDAGKMQIARNPASVVDLARNVEGRFAAAATQRGLALATVAGPVAPIAIDSAWIENALTNLVANAMRFARSSVTVKVREDEGSVVLEVEDDGQGIAEKDLDAVFDRFAQGSDMEARKGGTGLGLAIVREAARLHGGEASVRSVPGVATTFSLTLPRAMAANAAGQSLRPPSPSDAPAALTTLGLPQTMSADPAAANSGAISRLEWPGPDPSAPLVIVAEDDDDLRAFTSEVLASTYRVRATRNGEEALALVAELRPDAVVSDVVMPKMDGYELCKALRKRDDTRALPIILLTARRDVGRVLEGFEAGADDYVTKPFQARELLARVNVHVRLRRIVSEMAHRERLASLGMLAASLAHQVRNPLNAILAGLPAVRRKLAAAMAPRDDDMFGAMIDSGERINTLIKDLMDLSRVDQEVVSRFRPADGVRACIRLIEARIHGTVHLDAELDDTIEIEGKAGDLSHVFLNLIDNAVRAAEPAGRVHVAVERRGDNVIFEIGDSGVGVAPEKHEAVFAPFYTTRAAGDGTGLGLAIARQVVIQHGGTISIGRSPLGGALFTVALPSSLGANATVVSATVH
jgi:signal transduction histidine kinase